MRPAKVAKTVKGRRPTAWQSAAVVESPSGSDGEAQGAAAKGLLRESELAAAKAAYADQKAWGSSFPSICGTSMRPFVDRLWTVLGMFGGCLGSRFGFVLVRFGIVLVRFGSVFYHLGQFWVPLGGRWAHRLDGMGPPNRRPISSVSRPLRYLRGACAQPRVA